MGIVYIPHQEIDQTKWDQCIHQSPNGSIYAFSAYLNALCKTWDALILDDYQAVMPLTKRKKWGIHYLYQPPFIQQSGVFGKCVDKEMVFAFVEKAKKQVRFAEIHLNHLNDIDESIPRTNQIISLNTTYNEIRKSYASSLIRKLKQANQEKIAYKKIETSTSIEAYHRLYKNRTPHVLKDSYDALQHFCSSHPMMCLGRGLFYKDIMISSLLALKDDRRIYILMPAAQDPNHFSYATHALIDQLIQEFANTPLILDFEGSDLLGVQHFNEGFGAKNQPYYFLKWNNLPWPLRLLKP